MRRDENVLNCYHSHKILIDIVMMPMFDLRCLVRSETGNLFMTRWNIREAKYSSHFLRVFCPFHSYSLLWLCPRISVFRVQIEDKCDLKNLAVIIWPDSRILPLYLHLINKNGEHFLSPIVTTVPRQSHHLKLESPL